MPMIIVPIVAALLAQSTTRVSVDSSGAQANNASRYPVTSGDGRYVVFDSYASNLVAGDTNNVPDCFVVDRQTGMVTRVSVSSSGGQGNDASYSPTISSDGTVVAFSSYASNLVPGDTNKNPDVFVHELLTGNTFRPSRDEHNNQAPLGGWGASLSSDGHYVAFGSQSPLVSSDGNTTWDVYVRDRIANTIQRVSLSASGGDPDLDCTAPVLSTDGTLCSFETHATNIVSGDTNGWNDIYVRDLVNATNIRASLATDGTQPDLDCYIASISDDSRFVAFTSPADNLVAGDLDYAEDVFMKELATGTLEQISLDSSSHWFHYGARDPSISSDGRYVAFDSPSYDAVDGDNNNAVDVFVRDRVLGMTTRVSMANDGSEGNNTSYFPSISDDGSVVAFGSAASNLVSGDTNASEDVFVHERDLSPASWTNYGSGLAGTKGVPNLVASANPTLNTTISIDLDDSAKWYTVGILLVGLQRDSIPAFGGTVLVDPLYSIPVSIPPGTMQFDADIPPDETLAGVVVDVQALESDHGAPRGVSMSPGLELVLGF